jgi:hypothetical protein
MGSRSVVVRPTADLAAQRPAQKRPERMRVRHPRTRETGHQPPICPEKCTAPPVRRG